MQATRNIVNSFLVISLHVFMSVFVFVFVSPWRNGSGWDGTAEVSQGLDRQPRVANHVPHTKHCVHSMQIVHCADCADCSLWSFSEVNHIHQTKQCVMSSGWIIICVCETKALLLVGVFRILKAALSLTATFLCSPHICCRF